MFSFCGVKPYSFKATCDLLRVEEDRGKAVNSQVPGHCARHCARVLSSHSFRPRRRGNTHTFRIKMKSNYTLGFPFQYHQGEGIADGKRQDSTWGQCGPVACITHWTTPSVNWPWWQHCEKLLGGEQCWKGWAYAHLTSDFRLIFETALCFFSGLRLIINQWLSLRSESTYHLLLSTESTVCLASYRCPVCIHWLSKVCKVYASFQMLKEVYSAGKGLSTCKCGWLFSRCKMHNFIPHKVRVKDFVLLTLKNI